MWEINNLVELSHDSLLLTGLRIFWYLCCQFLFAGDKYLLKLNNLEFDFWLNENIFLSDDFIFVPLELLRVWKVRVKGFDICYFWSIISLSWKYWISIWHQTEHNWTVMPFTWMNLINFNPDFIKLSFGKRFLLKFMLFTRNVLCSQNARDMKQTEPAQFNPLRRNYHRTFIGIEWHMTVDK